MNRSRQGTSRTKQSTSQRQLHSSSMLIGKTVEYELAPLDIDRVGDGFTQ